MAGLEQLTLTGSTATPGYTQHQYEVEQVLALATSSFSFVMGLLALYCFAKMKRTFRHHLIMLLITSNMIKTLGYLFYPILQLSHTVIPSALCTADGFILAFGIEATDCVILLIALHTFLTVFKHGTISDESGLYPYRHLAHICLFIYPSVMASVAFINGDDAYTSIGPFCYLPARPVWYRLTLSWVPRYIILTIIIMVYLAVYCYVKIKFADFEATSSSCNDSALCVGGEPELHGTCSSGSSDHVTDGTQVGLRNSSVNEKSKYTLPQTGLPPSTNVRKDANVSVMQRHAIIRRQLRLLFVYPIIYLLMWIPNFVNHCWLYRVNNASPFVLTSISIFSLGAQGAVEAIVFLWGEKPWRRIQRLPKGPYGRRPVMGQRMHSNGMEVNPIRKRAQDASGNDGQDGGMDWWEHRAGNGNRARSYSESCRRKSSSCSHP